MTDPTPTTDTATAVNIELLDKALARIDANPDTWRQASWHCGTAACLAGHVALAAGYQWASDDAIEVFVTSPDGAITDEVASVAEDLLGLDSKSAFELFWCANTREDLQRMRDVLANDPQADASALHEARQSW
jgi:hypothetical protein